MMNAPQGGTQDAVTFARRLMLVQYGMVRANESGVAEGRVKPLHDLRVSIRRLRALLRTFHRVLGAESRTLERRLDRLSELLGPARDADVSLRLLRHPATVRRFRKTRSLEPLILRLVHAQREGKAAVREVVTSAAYRDIFRDVGAFLSGELPLAGGMKAPQTLEPLAAKALKKALARVSARAGIAPQYAKDPVHHLRIACRRARYLAEFFTELFGEPSVRLARRMKSLQDVLGDIHDLDVLLETLAALKPRCPRPVRLVFESRRRNHEDAFEKAWRRFRRDGSKRIPGF